MKADSCIVAGDATEYLGRAVFTVTESDLPLSAVRPGSALAIICGTQGPSYRPCGAGMAIASDGTITGHLSAGCIDRDVAHHAQQVIRDGQRRRLRYGEGSPFKDLTLPCGGGLDILIIPAPDARIMQDTRNQLARRRPAYLPCGEDVLLRVLPDLRLLVFGNGPEARIFAGMVHSAGYNVVLFSSDPETFHGVEGFEAALIGKKWPSSPTADERTAITLFFHDHDREIQILQHGLNSPAFYIGAMGSARAASRRAQMLVELGIPPDQIARLAQPFGTVPSTRNPRSLAVSVLADILSQSAHA